MDKSLQCRTIYFLRTVQWTLRTQCTVHTSIEQIELVMSNKLLTPNIRQ